MADSDWDAVTKIGSKVRGPGTAMRETTIKGKSALNAAQRSGAIIGTEKKYTSANVSSNSAGQRLTKVDRADGPVATKKVPEEVAKALAYGRTQLKNQKGGTMTQKDLAAKANVDVAKVAALERAGSDFPDMDTVNKLQKAVNVRLTGKDIGQPMRGPKKAEVKAESPKAKTPVEKEPETPAGATTPADAAVATGDENAGPASAGPTPV